MELLTKDRYSRAYVEVLEIIKHMGKEYQEKIPQNLLQLFENNKDENYQYIIDNTKNIKEHKLLDETLGLLSIIELKYWANAEEKELLNKALQDNERKYQEKLSEIYNTDNLFKDKKEKTKNIDENENSLIEFKESAFKRFINKIKKFFHIK